MKFKGKNYSERQQRGQTEDFFNDGCAVLEMLDLLKIVCMIL